VVKIDCPKGDQRTDVTLGSVSQSEGIESDEQSAAVEARNRYADSIKRLRFELSRAFANQQLTPKRAAAADTNPAKRKKPE
jgi:hypothetical protein